MDISGRILREVEFRDRLRGYDTEEVDEFLEKVATALDGVLAELEQLRSAAPATERDLVDDESLRRTLVLAQRTADLAIKEARDEASSLLEDARTQSDTLVGSAREEAKRLRDSAEADADAKISELEVRRTELEGEVEALIAFVENERRKLLSGLNTALEAVSSSLQRPSEPPTVGGGDAAAEARSEALHRRMRRDVTDADEGGPPTRLVEAAVVEEEESRPAEAEPPGSGPQAAAEPPTEAKVEVEATAEAPSFSVTGEAALAEVESVVDPDEELWQRWAKGSDLDAGPEARSRVLRSSSRDERRGRDWSA